MEGLKLFTSVASPPVPLATDPVITGTSSALRETSLPTKPQPLPATSNADVWASRAVQARGFRFLEAVLNRIASRGCSCSVRDGGLLEAAHPWTRQAINGAHHFSEVGVQPKACALNAAIEFGDLRARVIQDMADVGSLVWDAEVVLAHYIDLTHGFRLRGMRFLELGAGTGLAGIVAAKLGATVFLTDQSKLLPTIIANARANAPELEISSTSSCERNSLRDSYPSEGCQVWEKDDPAAAADAAARASSSLQALTRQSAELTREGGAQLSDPFSGMADAAKRAKSLSDNCATDVDAGIEMDEVPNTKQGPLRILDPGSHQRGCDLGHHKTGCKVDVHTPGLERPGVEARGIDTRGVKTCARSGGSWRVAELSFSEDESELRAAVGLGAEDNGCSALFDLVVAADVVYLVHLWDALAFTIKTLVKPGGEALLSFEQRRGSVDGFFSAPRFGPLEPARLAATADDDRDEWSQGEEVIIEDESACTALGKAAVAANLRMFRVTRRDKSPPPAAGGGGAEVSLGHGMQRSTCP